MQQLLNLFNKTKKTHMQLVAHALGLFVLSLITTTTNAYDSNDPLIPEATKNANVELKKYVASCNGKNFIKIGKTSYLEFNDQSASVSLYDVFQLSEADKLNGIEWDGRFEVNLGKVYRTVEVKKGIAEYSPWDDFYQSVEFEIGKVNGAWKLGGYVHTPSATLISGVSCEEVPKQTK